MIELKNVSKIYRPFKNGESVGLKNINLTFKDKGLVFIVGKSGSGKSTLLNLLGTLDKPTSGEIIINGKNLSKLKEKEIDSYRSHYIGSIFQEFNLLEDFDVYSNIELSANLKKAKVKKDVIDKLLDVVGISGKGTRKINELSGGEKARVGIARALVKNPNIILADEPTGNLDTNTTAEIIKILKTISLNKLVIVVTHDVNMALDYADRIIELKDGSVLKDEVYNDYEIINSTLDLKKTKLPLPVSIKLALKNLKIKKGKLIITTFLVTFALSTFALAMSLTNYDTSLAHAKVMVKNNESNVTIKKTIDGKIQNEKYFISYFKDEDLRNIDSLTTHPYSKKMILSSNNSGLQLTLGELEESETYLYYDLTTDKNQYIIEMPSSELNELDIIGSIPKNNEILIHKLFADYIIHYGINVEGYDINKGSIIELYKPNSYEEIINSDKNYIFGNKRVKISGIINDDLTQYDKYKNLTYLDIEDDKTLSNLYSKLNKKSDEWLNYFVTSDQFLNNIKLEENTLLDNDRYLIRYLYNNEKYENGSAISNYTGEVPIDLGITDSCYDGNEFIHLKDFESLNEDEIIINASLIDSITNKKYTEIVKRISEEYKNDFSSYEINNYHDIYVYALEEIEREYHFIGSEITLELRTRDESKFTSNYKIKGIALADMFIYVGKDSIKDYIYPNVIVPNF